MIMYRVVVQIDHDAEPDWLLWMTSSHIPDVLATGFFSDAQIFRQLEPVTNPDRGCYHIEYRCANRETLTVYQTTAAAALQKDHTDRFAGRFEAHRLILEDGASYPAS